MANNRLVTSQLWTVIDEAIRYSQSVYILASFAMESGIRIITPSLQQQAGRGVMIKILVGDYLYITEPEALCRLHTLAPGVDTRLWISSGKSFHPKAYLFHHPLRGGKVIVGSSNLSRSALWDGIEWNLAVDWAQEDEIFDDALEEFLALFTADQAFPLDESIIENYSAKYAEFHLRNPQVLKSMIRDEFGEHSPKPDFVVHRNQTEVVTMETSSPYIDDQRSFDSAVIAVESREAALAPRYAQNDALSLLASALEADRTKALVVMATGLGKTYLAAFFAQRFFHRVLFVAHREEILRQAQQSFHQIMSDRTHGLYAAKFKEKDADCVFASINTIGLSHHYQKFDPDEFDLLIIDEFHHAAADSYQRLLNYFRPRFLLGLTATPDRMDGKEIYELCDGNVAYEIRFFEAISRGWLAPFRYYGVYDDTDYREIRWLGTRYDQEELFSAQMKSNIASNLYEAWGNHRQTRTLGFCSSFEQARYLCDYFQQQGHTCIHLHANSHPQTRKDAIRQLESGELELIFTVDLFNEGVDIPAVDTLLFARPTESMTIFTQQIGRGLRLSEEKEHCNIIDLIGNYRNVNKKFGVFRQSQEESRDSWADLDPEHLQTMALPVNCEINFDLRAIELLKELSIANRRKYQYISPNSERQKDASGQHYEDLRGKYHGYPGYNGVNGLGAEEQKAYQEKQSWFQALEKTGMQKSYKMVLLLAILDRGPLQWLDVISPLDVAFEFHSHLVNDEDLKQIDFSDKTGQGLWEYHPYKMADLIARNPMKALNHTSGDYFYFENGQFRITLDFDSDAEKEIAYVWTYEVALKLLNDYKQKKQSRVRM